MNHIKTVKRFVAGSHKFFDIYECTVDEVDTYTSSTGKAMVKVSIKVKNIMVSTTNGSLNISVPTKGNPLL